MRVVALFQPLSVHQDSIWKGEKARNKRKGLFPVVLKPTSSMHLRWFAHTHVDTLSLQLSVSQGISALPIFSHQSTQSSLTMPEMHVTRCPKYLPSYPLEVPMPISSFPFIIFLQTNQHTVETDKRHRAKYLLKGNEGNICISSWTALSSGRHSHNKSFRSKTTLSRTPKTRGGNTHARSHARTHLKSLLSSLTAHVLGIPIPNSSRSLIIFATAASACSSPSSPSTCRAHLRHTAALSAPGSKETL